MSSRYRSAIVYAALSCPWCAPAWADCVSDCDAATYCDSEMHASGECADKLGACYQRECGRVRYGAIAYDAESGAYGWSNELYDAPAAEARALANCREHSEACKIVYDFWNSCAALAADADHRYAIGRADTRQQAEAEAIAACRQETGTSCDVEVWSCTGQ